MVSIPDDPAIQQALELLDRFRSDPELRELNRRRRFALLDQLNANAAKAKGKAKVIVRFLIRRFGAIPQEVENKLYALRDLDQLDRLSDFAYDCNSLDEFVSYLHSDQPCQFEVKMPCVSDDPAIQQLFEQLDRIHNDPELMELDRQRRLALLDQALTNRAIEEGKAKTIIALLNCKFNCVPKNVQNKLIALWNLEQHDRLVTLIRDSESIEEFASQLRLFPVE